MSRRHRKRSNPNHNPNLHNRCERCGSELNIQINRKNGNRFYGCKRFPDCRFTKPFLETPQPSTITTKQYWAAHIRGKAFSHDGMSAFWDDQEHLLTMPDGKQLECLFPDAVNLVHDWMVEREELRNHPEWKDHYDSLQSA